TVKPGTSQEIHKKTKLHLIHTPFLGVHPLKPKSEFVHGEGYTLFDYFTRFPKMIGPTSLESGKLAQKHFKSVGLRTEVFDSSMETELAKVLCTTYYGWNIIFEKWVHQVCQEHGVNFDQVYTR